ncbi:MAG: ABC transporter permease, partial [Bryobacteraceae bacterium]
PDQLSSLSYPDYFDFRKENHTLASSAVYGELTVAFTDGANAQSLAAIKATGEFFDVLGIKPLIGRGFVRADEAAGGGPGGYKVVLSYDFWQKQFGGDKSVLGRTIQVDRRSCTVIGVMPARVQYPIRNDPVEIYETTAEDAESLGGSKPITQQRGNHCLGAIARLKPGVSAAQAQADLATIAARLEKQYPDSNSYFSVLVKPLRDELVGDVRPALYVLFGAVVCVLLIANANVANLLLARASVRGKEIALRAALGASRSRIVRQLLTESVLLAACGGLVGLIIAEWGTSALIHAVPQNIPRIGDISLDHVVLAFTLIVSLATGIVFGLVPAWQASHVDLNT